MKTDYSNLLEKTIYLEGLIRIAASRVEPEPELLAMLSRESAAIADALARKAPMSVADIVETFVAPEPAPAPVEEYTATITETDSPAVAPASEPEAVAVDETETIAETPEAPAAPEAEAETETEAELEAEPFRLEDKVASKAAGSISRLFTLNDKFRFSRELFNNSQSELDETLSVLDEMSSLDEAREYLTDDLCLDPASPAVKDFFVIVAKHFA